MPVTEPVQEFLQKIGDVVTKDTAEVLSTVISKDVNITMGDITDLDAASAAEALPTPTLLVKFNFSSREEDEVFLFLEQALAVKIASWMMMEEDVTKEFSDEHLNSIKETAEQLLGNLGDVLSGELDRQMTFGSVRADVTEFSEDNIPVSDPVQIIYTVNLGADDTHQVVEFISQGAVEQFLQSAGDESTDADEGAAEDADAADMGDMGDMPDMAMDGEGDIGADMAEMTAGVMAPAAGPGALPQSPEQGKLGLLMDITLPLSIELGRTKMLIKDILELGHGSVIEFDKLAGEPVDLMINDKKVAEGEVVVIDEHFGIRLTNLATAEEMLQGIKEEDKE